MSEHKLWQVVADTDDQSWQISDDELRAYVNGEMSGPAREEFEAFLAVSPELRLLAEDLRRETALEAAEARHGAKVSGVETTGRWNLLRLWAFASTGLAIASLAAVFIVANQSKTTPRPLVVAANKQEAEAEVERRVAERTAKNDRELQKERDDVAVLWNTVENLFLTEPTAPASPPVTTPQPPVSAPVRNLGLSVIADVAMNLKAALALSTMGAGSDTQDINIVALRAHNTVVDPRRPLTLEWSSHKSGSWSLTLQDEKGANVWPEPGDTPPPLTETRFRLPIERVGQPGHSYIWQVKDLDSDTVSQWFAFKTASLKDDDALKSVLARTKDPLERVNTLIQFARLDEASDSLAHVSRNKEFYVDLLTFLRTRKP